MHGHFFSLPSRRKPSDLMERMCGDWPVSKTNAQVEALHDVMLMVGVHGADLTNLIFLPTMAAVIEIGVECEVEGASVDSPFWRGPGTLMNHSILAHARATWKEQQRQGGWLGHNWQFTVVLLSQLSSHILRTIISRYLRRFNLKIVAFLFGFRSMSTGGFYLASRSMAARLSNLPATCLQQFTEKIQKGWACTTLWYIQHVYDYGMCFGDLRRMSQAIMQ